MCNAVLIRGEIEQFANKTDTCSLLDFTEKEHKLKIESDFKASCIPNSNKEEDLKKHCKYNFKKEDWQSFCMTNGGNYTTLQNLSIINYDLLNET